RRDRRRVGLGRAALVRRRLRSARPIYFGSEATYGGRFVWPANDDERYRHGSTVTKVDPRTGRVVAKPIALLNPQSLTHGAGAVWVADHGGALVKSSIWSASARIWGGPPRENDDRVLRIDPHSMKLVET